MDPTQPNAWREGAPQPPTGGAQPGQPQPYPQAPPAYPPYHQQGQTQYPNYPQEQQPYGYYPQGYGPGWYPQQDPGNGLSIAAIVLGVISILFLPIIFGPIGLILAGIAKSKHQRLSTAALWVSGGGMILGFIIGALVVTAMY